MKWERDKRWSDKFIPEIKRILGEQLICEAPEEEDMLQNTDLRVFKLEGVRVACRVRKNSFLAGFGRQFTIRSSRPSGNKTELEKIMEGFGDYTFYCFADAEDKGLAQWFLGDLDVFRSWYSKGKGEQCGNYDGSSSFVAFNLKDLPANFVIASSGFPLSLAEVRRMEREVG